MHRKDVQAKRISCYRKTDNAISSAVKCQSIKTKIGLKICVKSININSCEFVIPFYSGFFQFYKTTIGCDLNITTLIEGCGLATIYMYENQGSVSLNWHEMFFREIKNQEFRFGFLPRKWK